MQQLVGFVDRVGLDRVGLLTVDRVESLTFDQVGLDRVRVIDRAGSLTVDRVGSLTVDRVRVVDRAG